MCIYNLNSNVEDLETDPITYIWEYRINSGNWMTFGGNNSSVTTPDFSNVGEVEIRLTINDGINENVISNVLIINVIESVISNVFEVGIGDCDIIPQTWITVYSSSNVPLSNGDIIYTDSALTVPFNGNNNTYRSRINSSLINQRQFDINNSGVVLNDFGCSNSIVIQQSNDNSGEEGCSSCSAINVLVPNGETRQVQFSKNGLAPYASSTNACDNQGSTISNDQILNITEDTLFNFGIDADKGTNNPATTTITVTVRDGSTVIDTYSFSRTHTDPVNIC